MFQISVPREPTHLVGGCFSPAAVKLFLWHYCCAREQSFLRSISIATNIFLIEVEAF